MDVKVIVYIFDSITENNIHKCDELCTNLVREANSVFDVKISFGGNAAAYGPVLTRSLDAKFIPEDVANLEMMSYHEAIIHRSFFQDKILVSQYFQYCPNVQDLFCLVGV